MAKMYRITLLVFVAWLLSAFAASAERIKRKPPTESEAARAASDQAMNDGTLQPGDIVATDRGFLQFRGLGTDGTVDFVPVQNPVRRSVSPTR
jgi:hypothetical protein